MSLGCMLHILTRVNTCFICALSGIKVSGPVIKQESHRSRDLRGLAKRHIVF